MLPARWLLYVDAGETPEDVLHQLRHHSLSHSTEGRYLRTEWRDADARGRVREWLEKKLVPPVPALEADVGPLKRHLADAGARVDVRPECVCWFDLETDSRVPFSRKEEMRVLAWSVRAYDGTHVAGSVLADDSDAAERDLLLAFFRAVGPFDVAASWNGDRFDEPVLRARAANAGLDVQWGRWSWLDHLGVYEKYSIALTGEQKQSLALEAVARSLLGRGKVERDGGSHSWELWCSDRERLRAYNEGDTELMAAIEAKTRYVRLHLSVCSVCGLLPSTRSLHANEIVDGYMLRLGQREGYRWQSRPESAAGSPFEGALVLDPVPGVYHDVRVVDFASLYPSVIQTFNISPETLLRTPEQRDAARDAKLAMATVPKVGHSFRADSPGLFPMALDDLVSRRKAMQREQAAIPAGTPEWEELDGLSKAFKVVINSFYGVMGSIYSRYYVRQCGESVSQGARWLTESLLDFIARRWPGVRVVAGDTDSAMMLGSDEDVAAMVRAFNTEHVPALLSRYGCPRNTVKLEYEKVFRRVVMVAKKRYAAAVGAYKGTSAKAGAVEIKGLEYKRGDQVKLAREFQKEVVDLLLRDGPVPDEDELAGVVGRWRTRLREGEVALDDVVIAQSLNRDEYKAATPPPHVRVAAIMKARGEDVGVGARIRYWISGSKPKLTPEPASDFDPARIDRGYYWENRVWPPTQRLLEAAVPSARWEALSRLTDGVRRRSRKAEPQGDLFSRPPPEVVVDPDHAAGPSRSECVVVVDGRVERDWPAAMEAAKAVAAANPGPRQLTLVVQGDGSRTTVETTAGVGDGAARQLEQVFGKGSVRG